MLNKSSTESTKQEYGSKGPPVLPSDLKKISPVASRHYPVWIVAAKWSAYLRGLPLALLRGIPEL